MISENDDNISYLKDAEFLKEIIQRETNVFANDILSIGDDLLNEISLKNFKAEKEKLDLIKKIIKKNKKYTKDELITYSLPDVKHIFNEIKAKKSFLTKIIYFLFNLD
jgi:hypothetical protein